MRTKESVKEVLNYFQTLENKEILFAEDAISAAYQKDIDSQPLAIKALSIFGGLLACLTFLGFLFIAGLYDSEYGLLIFGAICIVSAISINKFYDKIIVDSISVSAFIIGFVLVAVGLLQLEINESVISVLFIVIALISLTIAQNYILSFISVLIINASIITLIASNNYYELIHLYLSAVALLTTYLFLNEAKIITLNAALAKLYNPIRIGLIFSFLSGLIILGEKQLFPITDYYIWISSVIIIASIFYLISNIFQILDINKLQQKISIYGVCTLLLLPTALAPAISGAILIIFLSFLVNYKTGFFIGVIAFIYFISQYYYDLNFTLLTKSIVLFSSGVFFIALYLFTYKKLSQNEKV